MKPLIFFSLIALIILACGQGKSPGKSSEGKAIFGEYCVLCHGADGKSNMNGAKDLSLSEASLEERIHLISKGKGMMTPFEEILSPEQIKAVAQFTFELKSGR